MSEEESKVIAEEVEQESLASSPALTSTLSRPLTDTSHWAATYTHLVLSFQHSNKETKSNQQIKA